MRYYHFIYCYRKFLLLFLLPCFIYSKCRKDDLPEYYFRCKVNGQDYQPNSCANCRTADLIGDTTFILGANRDFESLGIGMKDLNGIVPKEQLLNHLDLRNKGGGGSFKNSTLSNDIYRTDQIRTGKLVIDVIDRNRKVISGTFYFKAYNAYRNDSITVTDGQFRLQYP